MFAVDAIKLLCDSPTGFFAVFIGGHDAPLWLQSMPHNVVSLPGVPQSSA
jgi:hypothetical protein